MNMNKYPSLISHRLTYKPDDECTFRESKIEETCCDKKHIKKLIKLFQKQILYFAPKDFDWNKDETTIQIRNIINIIQLEEEEKNE